MRAYYKKCFDYKIIIIFLMIITSNYIIIGSIDSYLHDLISSNYYTLVTANVFLYFNLWRWTRLIKIKRYITIRISQDQFINEAMKIELVNTLLFILIIFGLPALILHKQLFSFYYIYSFVLLILYMIYAVFNIMSFVTDDKRIRTMLFALPFILSFFSFYVVIKNILPFFRY